MTKILNNRPLFYCLLAFGLGIFFARPIFLLEVGYCVFAGLSLVALIFLCVKFKRIKRLLVILIAVCLGALTFFISLACYDAKDYGTGNHDVVGRVCVSTVYDSSQNVILENVYVDGEKIDKNIQLYIYNTTEVEVGNIISFEGEISVVGLFTFGKFNSYNYKYNVPYSCNMNYEDISVDDLGSLTWSEALKQRVKGILDSNMNLTEAGVGYASLFGDKSSIPSEVKDSFSISGIAHLLAISGLHIGFVAVLLSFILKVFKVNKYARVILILSFLGAYCYVCSFSASVIRATLMWLIMELAGLFGKQYDRLNAWSLAGFVCLMFRPLNVFDGGFLLSFGCVFCIFLFAKPMEKLFERWHLPKKLAGTLGVVVPVQFGLLPLISVYYSSTSLLSIVANLIAVPLFEVFFIMLFIVVLLTLIIPALNFLLVVPELLIKGIIGFAGFVAQQKWAIINLTTLSGLVVITVYSVMFIASHYTNLNRKKKLISSWCILVIALIISTLSLIKCDAANNKITVINARNKDVYCLELNNISFVVGYFDEFAIDSVQSYALKSKLYSYDYYISLNNSIPQDTELFHNIYTCASVEGCTQLAQGEEYNFNNVRVTSVILGNKFAGLLFENQNMKIFICGNNSFNAGLCMDFETTYGTVDIILGAQKYIDSFKQFTSYNYLISSGQNVYVPNSQETINYNGNWTFDYINSKITNMRGVD